MPVPLFHSRMGHYWLVVKPSLPAKLPVHHVSLPGELPICSHNVTINCIFIVINGDYATHLYVCQRGLYHGLSTPPWQLPGQVSRCHVKRPLRMVTTPYETLINVHTPLPPHSHPTHSVADWCHLHDSLNNYLRHNLSHSVAA